MCIRDSFNILIVVIFCRFSATTAKLMHEGADQRIVIYIQTIQQILTALGTVSYTHLTGRVKIRNTAEVETSNAKESVYPVVRTRIHIAERAGTVSYTHLDVYKRQHLVSQKFSNLARRSGTHSLCDIKHTVST